MSEENESPVQEAKKSLVRIQDFNAKSLIQQDRLGAENSFSNVVEPAEKLISLFKQLPAETLDMFPDQEVTSVKQQADVVFNIFDEVLSFSTDEGDVRNRRDALITKVANSYQGVFSRIFPIISFSISRTVDFDRLETMGRAAVQSISDRAKKLEEDMRERFDELASITDTARKVAAEQGVSQEAFYFKEEAERHSREATKWAKITIGMAISVIAFGIASVFSYKWDFLSPSTVAESIQYVASKLVIFFVLAFGLLLSARNFMSNRHNEIVNRHRQNALMTYKSLVDAGGTPEARDVILQHAASSVYGLHDTGYIRNENSSAHSPSVIEMIPRIVSQSGGPS